MRLSFQGTLLVSLLSLAFCLRCYHYKGPPDQAVHKQKAEECLADYHSCSSFLITFMGLLRVNVLVKGCTEDLENTCNTTEKSNVKGLETQRSKLCCDTDLCNMELEPDLGEDAHKWGKECLACNGSPSQCGGSSLPGLRCDPDQPNCIKVSITAAFEQDTNQIMIKSCSNSSTCPGSAIFSNGQHPVTYSAHHECCTGTHCNTGYFTDTDAGSENGLECYSQWSPQSVTTMKCRGDMTHCIDLIGDSPGNILMSGCATESFCQGLYPHISVPGWRNTTCCSESLCNHGNTTNL